MGGCTDVDALLDIECLFCLLVIKVYVKQPFELISCLIEPPNAFFQWAALLIVHYVYIIDYLVLGNQQHW